MLVFYFSLKLLYFFEQKYLNQYEKICTIEQ